MDTLRELLRATATETSAALWLITFSIPLIMQMWIIKRRKSSNLKNFLGNKMPEAPGAWPVVGHLPLLVGPKLPHHTLGDLADKCGPVFMIRVGVHRSVVVSSWEVAKECYTKNDIVFASRPASTAAEIIGHNYASFGFAPYGAYWRDIRKIMMAQLFSKQRLELCKDVRDFEIDSSMKKLYALSCSGQTPVVVEMKKWFGDLTLNLMLRVIVSKRFTGDEVESNRFKIAMRSFMKLMGVVLVGDALPFLRWFDFQGYKKEMKNTIAELDSFFQVWYEEHQKRRLAVGEGDAMVDHDFMDVMISALENVKISDDHDKDTIIKATCLSILAGSDTTMITLTWILSLLLNNKRVLKKAQDELDNHVGRDRRVTENDVDKLVYLDAIIKEALRIYPAGPLSGPRVATEDCTLAGYHVPAGTRVIVNLSKIQRDPKVWSDPTEFLPERFLTTHKDMDVKGQINELLPFASGRRACPGISLALQLMPLAVARLLQGFDLTNPIDKPIDMSESSGLTNDKATSLAVHVTPRLRPDLY